MNNSGMRLKNKDIQDPNPRGRYEFYAKRAEKLYHDGWYGSPAKRPASKTFLENFDQINWDKGGKT